jgi:hypothetical protein
MGNVGHFDPLGETVPSDTVYTLAVHVPPRPNSLSEHLPKFLTRTPVKAEAHVSMIRPDDTNPNLDRFERKHLDYIKLKNVKIKMALFPIDMRCQHLRYSITCAEGCYFMEEGGSHSRSKCNREDCQGHVYQGHVHEDDEGRKCFGKKGHRMVCIKDWASKETRQVEADCDRLTNSS